MRIGETILDEAKKATSPLKVQRPTTSERSALQDAVGKFQVAWMDDPDIPAQEKGKTSDVMAAVLSVASDAEDGLWVPCLKTLYSLPDMEVEIRGASGTITKLSKGLTPTQTLTIEIEDVVKKIAARLGRQWGDERAWKAAAMAATTTELELERELDSFTIDYPWVDHIKEPKTKAAIMGVVERELEDGWGQASVEVIKKVGKW